MKFITIIIQHIGCKKQSEERREWENQEFVWMQMSVTKTKLSHFLFVQYQATHNENISKRQRVRKTLALLLKNRSKERRDGEMEVGERGMEWDRKWKAFSGFTPRDLISVIMGFMSFPSRRPHTTSHVPGHTHTHTPLLQPVYFIHWLGDEHRVHVFLSHCLPFLTLCSSTFHILHHKPGC